MPDALDQLTKAAGTGRFDHVVAQLREQQASWQAQLKAEAPWRDKGFTVLEQRPRSWDVDCVDIGYLRDADGKPVDDSVVTDPSRWAVLVEEEEAVLDVQTGEVVDESTVDWDTDDDPDAEPREGLRHAKTVKDGTVHAPAFYCLDYHGVGFTLDNWFLRNAGIIVASTESDDVDADNSDDEAAAARAAALAKAQAAQAENQRRERKRVIALNRLGDAAITVYHGHAPVICRRHHRWLGIPTAPGQFDLSNNPEIITATRRRDRLLRSPHDQRWTDTQFRAAAWVTIGWSGMVHLCWHRQLAERWEQRRATIAATGRTPPERLVLLPETAVLAEIFCDPRWRRQLATSSSYGHRGFYLHVAHHLGLPAGLAIGVHIDAGDPLGYWVDRHRAHHHYAYRAAWRPTMPAGRTLDEFLRAAT